MRRIVWNRFSMTLAAVVLVVALILWVRSIWWVDFVLRRHGAVQSMAFTFPGGCGVERKTWPDAAETPLHYVSAAYGDRARAARLPWRYLGFGYENTPVVTRLTVPFWPFVALGAWCLLRAWRRRALVKERGFEVEPVMVGGLVPREGRR